MLFKNTDTFVATEIKVTKIKGHFIVVNRIYLLVLQNLKNIIKRSGGDFQKSLVKNIVI